MRCGFYLVLLSVLLVGCIGQSESSKIIDSIQEDVTETKKIINALPSDCKGAELTLRFEMISNKAETLKATQDKIIAQRDTLISRLKFALFVAGASIIVLLVLLVKRFI